MNTTTSTKAQCMPDDTNELLLALHKEFYGGPLAHANAFRILPRVVAEREVMRTALKKIENESIPISDPLGVLGGTFQATCARFEKIRGIARNAVSVAPK